MAVEWTITIEGKNEFGDVCRKAVHIDKSWERLFDGDLGLSIEDGKRFSKRQQITGRRKGHISCSRSAREPLMERSAANSKHGIPGSRQMRTSINSSRSRLKAPHFFLLSFARESYALSFAEEQQLRLGLNEIVRV